MWISSYGVSNERQVREKQHKSQDSRVILALDLQLFAEGEKTEQATPRRRDEARKKGQVAKTMELGTGVTLLGVFLLLRNLGGFFVSTVTEMMQAAFEDWMLVPTLDARSLQAMAGAAATVFAQLTLPIMGAALVLGAGSQLAQVGFMLIGEGLKPKLNRINPIEGFKRVFSKRAWVELAKAVLKIGIVGYVVYWSVRSQLPVFLGMLHMHPDQAAVLTWQVVSKAGIFVGISLLAIALLDYLYQRFEHEQSLRMSKQEVKEEMKQTEGDPLIRSKIRQRQRQMAMNRMMQEVPKADVIITNPTHIAVALKYDEAAMDAPVVVAMGAGFVAQRIKDIAANNTIPTIENKPLARALFETASIGETIPAQLYQAVAEVLAVVYQLRQKRG